MKIEYRNDPFGKRWQLPEMNDTWFRIFTDRKKRMWSSDKRYYRVEVTRKIPNSTNSWGSYKTERLEYSVQTDLKKAKEILLDWYKKYEKENTY